MMYVNSKCKNICKVFNCTCKMFDTKKIIFKKRISSFVFVNSLCKRVIKKQTIVSGQLLRGKRNQCTNDSAIKS